VITGPDDRPGINGGLLQRSGPLPAAGQGMNAFVCTMEVDDYDETERQILAAGGRAVHGTTAPTGTAWQGITSTRKAT
jgi:predicted enzyme related to lactoylglutathione lyase